MSLYHSIRMAPRDEVAVSVLRDIGGQFEILRLFIGQDGFLYFDIVLSRDDLEYMNKQWGWAIVSWCDLDQDDKDGSFI